MQFVMKRVVTSAWCLCVDRRVFAAGDDAQDKVRQDIREFLFREAMGLNKRKSQAAGLCDGCDVWWCVRRIVFRLPGFCQPGIVHVDGIDHGRLDRCQRCWQNQPLDVIHLSIKICSMRYCMAAGLSRYTPPKNSIV